MFYCHCYLYNSYYVLYIRNLHAAVEQLLLTVSEVDVLALLVLLHLLLQDEGGALRRLGGGIRDAILRVCCRGLRCR